MQNHVNNVLDFNNYRQVSKQHLKQPEVVYMPFIVYYPVYMPAPTQAETLPQVETRITDAQAKKDNVVSIYDYLGEI